MPKMDLHDSFEYLKHKLWPKKGLGVKVLIWLLLTKSQNHPEISAFRWRVTYHWKKFNKGYNFALDLTSIEGLHKKLWPSKMLEVSISGISKPPTWES